MGIRDLFGIVWTLGYHKGRCCLQSCLNHLYDLEAICQIYEQVTFFKFADDGSAKVTGESLEECLHYMNLVLGAVNDWTCQWRMVVNCNVNKTELICFYTNTPELLPSSYMIGGNTIYLNDQSKVLGVVIDKKLTFKEHSVAVYNKLMYRWIMLCRYTNRNWGLNQRVMIRIVKATMFSCLFYASMVWMNSSNMTTINSLWYKVAKSAVGAVYNVKSSVLEVILGVPPLLVYNRMITIKHYLKVLSEQPGDFEDMHIMFLRNELQSNNITIMYHLRDVYKFLVWKQQIRPEDFSASDMETLEDRNLQKFTSLSEEACIYSKVMIRNFTEHLWQESLNSQLQQDGETRIPKVSVEPLDIPFNTPRDDEVKLMSLFYKNNLLNSFLFITEPNQCPSPLCVCSQEEQTAFHILSNCILVNADIRGSISHHLMLVNDTNSIEELIPDNVTIINGSRNRQFLSLCVEVTQNKSLLLRTKITLTNRRS